jgi:hypothetical protein
MGPSRTSKTLLVLLVLAAVLVLSIVLVRLSAVHGQHAHEDFSGSGSGSGSGDSNSNGKSFNTCLVKREELQGTLDALDRIGLRPNSHFIVLTYSNLGSPAESRVESRAESRAESRVESRAESRVESRAESRAESRDYVFQDVGPLLGDFTSAMSFARTIVPWNAQDWIVWTAAPKSLADFHQSQQKRR